MTAAVLGPSSIGPSASTRTPTLAPVEFRMLGALEAWDGAEAIGIGGPKHRRVLAALALQPGRVVPVEQLIDAVWGEDPPATARRQVQNAVSALRQTAIGTVLEASGPGYRLAVARGQVDAARFEDAVTEARAAYARGDLAATERTLHEAERLWRGPALAGVGGQIAEQAANGLEEQRLSALTLWADAVIAAGRPEAVIDTLTGLLRRHPIREPLAGLLMLALHRCGRGAEALVWYHRVRDALSEQLGVEPGPPLRRLFEQLLAVDPALGSPGQATGRNGLPRDIPEFTGRSAEVERLTSLVDGSATVVHAVDGMPGVGKTALAVHAAHRLAGRFRHGQLFLDLHGHSERRPPLSPDEALAILLRAVGVPDARIPGNLDEKAALWYAELADRQVLVVLDDATGSAQVRPLLPGSPQCAVLITSRQRLIGLAGVRSLSLDTLPARDSVALFGRVAGEARIAGEPDAVAWAAELCGHLPLALSIAAARLRAHPAWTVRRLAERLADQHQRLHLLTAEDRGVCAALTLSYHHLPPDQRRLYRRLGLHPGTSIDRYTAAALADGDLRSVEVSLDALCEAHLLTETQLGRYRFHDLVRDHAQAQCVAGDDDADRDRARDRLLDYYLYVSDAAADHVSVTRSRVGPFLGPSPLAVPALAGAQDSLAWIESEHPNLVAVTRLAAERSTQHSWRIGRNIGNLLTRRGHLRTGAEVVEIALAAAERTGADPKAVTACLVSLTLMYVGLGRPDAALECLDRGIARARETGDEDAEIGLLPLIADIKNWQGAYADAVEVTSRAIPAYRERGNLPREAGCRGIQIEALVGLGDLARVRRATRSAHEMLDRLSGRSAYALSSRLGLGYSYCGEHEVAVELLGRAVDGVAADKAGLAQAGYLTIFARVLCRAGRPDEALERGREALRLLEEVPEAATMADAHNTLGEILRQLGRPEEALSHLRQALAIAGRAHYRVGQTTALARITNILARADTDLVINASEGRIRPR